MRKLRTRARPAITAAKGQPRDAGPTAADRLLVALLILAIVAFALWSRLIVIGAV